jgi:ribosome-associated toxin RatA of RatAB toxin-antitoxin module
VILPVLLVMAAQWSEIHRTPDLVVFSRPRDGVAVNEMHAVGVVDADAAKLWSLVRDIEKHTTLLPDTTVSRVLRTDRDDARVVLQRSEPTVLDPREYVIVVRERAETLADGRVRHTLSWRTSPKDAAQVHSDAVRVDVNEGFWAVEPTPDGRAKITFQLLFDPAGYVPSALVNVSQTMGAQQALAVLTKAAQ